MSDSDDDDVCYFGTPLEELDADDVRKTKAPRIEDQVVCDKQGRRRFHGAFTGGFSAGYFNSVGTKEGWTPSTFVSSRAQRAESQLAAKPQDFMDDEDLAAHGISPQGIQATTDFDDSEQRKRKRVIDPGGPIPGTPVLEEILKPTKETMGMKLLRRLGWKPGQGVGPRVKLNQKRLAQKETQRIYGCKMPQDMSNESDEDIDEENYAPDMTFAPDDIETLYLTTPKSDQFGLGYKPLDRTPVLGGHINLFDPSPLVMKEKKKKLLIKGQAFGVGAFEDEDEDIYATEDMSCYDFGEEKSTTKNTPQKAKSHMDLMGLVEMIDGFSLSSKHQSDSKVHRYPKPTVPKDFVPQHKSRRRRFELKENEVKGLGRHDMTSEQRARIIAERPQTTVEVRSGVKGQAVRPPKKSTEKSNDASEIDKILEEFQNLEDKSRSDFKPFAKNEEKQRRYELYLKMKDKGQKDRYYLAQPRSMTEWQKQREAQEFDRAAKLFRPLTSTMASRFVTAATEDSGLKLKDGLTLEVPKATEQSSTSEVDALGHDVADDRTKAAKMIMFGKLTQTTIDWYPDRLLCRRFNVPSPFPESNFVGVRKTKREKFSIFSVLDAPMERERHRRRDDSPPRPSSSKQKEESQEDEIIEETPETYGLKVPVDGPPTMDLFKAIFQDSDSENEEDNDETKESIKTDLDKETGAIENSSLPTVATVCSTGESSESEKTDGQSEISIKKSVDSFLSKMRRGNENSGDSVEETVSKNSQQRVRVSRFEPTKDTASVEVENTPKHVFVPRKKPQAPSEAVPAKGIFANIDFDILNSYRTSGNSKQNENEEDHGDETRDNVEEKNDDHQKVNSDSSVDSEDEYGPPVPVHLKNRQQMIRSPPSSGIQRMGSQEPKSKQESLWIVKDDKRRSEKKHRHTDKCKKKKEKKKKRHKERKHKKKSSKKSRRKSRSTSLSDSSDD